MSAQATCVYFVSDGGLVSELFFSLHLLIYSPQSFFDDLLLLYLLTCLFFQNSLLFRVKYEKSPADAVCEENELQRATCLLRNYRSTYPIASLLSGLFYDGKVKCKSFNETSNVYKYDVLLAH